MSRQFQFYSRQFLFVHGNFNLLTVISIFLTAISICSRQFQFQFTAISISAHGNSTLLTAISIYPRQFQFAHGNFNYGNFNFTNGDFNLLTAILLKAFSIFSRQRSRHFSLLSPPVSYGGRQWPRTKSQNAKSKVDI